MVFTPTLLLLSLIHIFPVHILIRQKPDHLPLAPPAVDLNGSIGTGHMPSGLCDETIGGDFHHGGHSIFKSDHRLKIVIHLMGKDAEKLAVHLGNLGIDEIQQLIAQMNAPIQNHAAAVDLIAPPAVERSPGPLYAALDTIRRADGLVLHNLFDRSVIFIPPAVLVDGK